MVTKKIKKRGRPRGFDVDQALAIATSLFHERGYDGVGIAELSKSIGISAPSLYSAFGSKRELFERVLKRYVQTSGCWLPAALGSEDGPDTDLNGDSAEDRLERAIFNLFTAAADQYAANPDCPGCLVMDGTRNCTDAEAKLLTAGFCQATWQMIRDRITGAVLDLRESEADVLANYAMVVLAGLSSRAQEGVCVVDLRSAAEIAAEGFIQKLRQYCRR